jgi:hypothetical protein
MGKMKLAKRIKSRLENINNIGINPLTIANPKKAKVIKEETFKPPSNVQKEAQKALDYRDKYGDEVKAGTQVGWTRANQLAKGEPVSLDTIRRMVSFFARHEGNETVKPELKDTPWKDNGYVAFLLWGGQAGNDWAKDILSKNESRLSVLLEQVYTPPKHLGFTRNNMPQIEDDKQEEFLKHLEDQGIKYKKTKMKVSDITPAQKEIRSDIATKLFKDNSPKLKKPLVVSSDNYLMDGHHRWLAFYQDNQNTQVDVYKVDTTGKKLIDLMKKFDPIRKGIE